MATGSSRLRSSGCANICGNRRRSACWWERPTIRARWAHCGRLKRPGRANECVIVGQNAEPEARAELRSARTRLIASVGYFPEKYGDGLLRLALDILGRKPVAPAVFTNHQIITPDNVDHFYPNDSLLSRA